ncbi:porin [bacterium M00.F.Ca.ET.228.01.1.1]|nr:porin [Paraburkholderia phenoliruptrix]MBW9099503.1 porin [Paraburkholderia phenoliruptrix]TGP42174.1 porin [bacterium M00.F.Ca.ET.228.01.1.1]TGR99607.1 porin [bacterium M00.F.Ca.ET.191.01.1.1]TGU03972.1 porin [bacterium M00.F.Ca.ET.155.01.1.1]
MIFSILFFCIGTAHAQDSVTLYGVIDSGISYTNNDNGKKLWSAVSGATSGSRWGLKGAEDLGGGLKAIFTLESGFNAFTGAPNISGRMFGRQAFVGFAGHFGSVTLGRQQDPINDYVAQYTSNGAWGGWYFSHPEDVDNTDLGFFINNAVKFTSQNNGGFTFGGIYSFGGVAGKMSRNQIWGVGGNYSHGAISAGLAYEEIRNPATAVEGYTNGGGFTNVVYGAYLAAASSQNIFGVGAGYSDGPVQLLASFTNTTFKNGVSNADVAFNNYEIAAAYSLTPAFQINGGYTYTTGRQNASSYRPKYHQFNLMADYNLSKRTDVYVQTSYQLAAGDATQAQNAGFDASSTKRQLAFRTALRHLF